MYRPGLIKMLAAVLAIGLLLGMASGPALWFGGAAGASAQSLPFTPTPEPTNTATVQPTASPTAMATAPATQTPIVVVATPTGLPPTTTQAPTALPGYGRDLCDPNHSLLQPCALATETENGPFNFNDGATDVFSFLLKGGRQYQISATVGGNGGIDPAIELFAAGSTAAPVATNDDAQLGDSSAAVTIAVQADAWYLARVANKAPGSPAGKTYTLSARSMAAGTGTPAQATNPDDLIGNAYDPEHAARLAWNVPYDLSMACPDPRPGACYAGRHSFLLVPVKADLAFTATTYDLGAGVDTVLTLYRPDLAQTQAGAGVLPGWAALAENDDIAGGWTLRSQISLTPNWSGLALLVVAPSERADLPPTPADGRPGRYRLIVGSPELANVKAALASQADLPPTPAPPTPRPTGQPAPAAVGAAPLGAPDAREVIKEACPNGLASVGAAETGLYAAAPPGRDDRIAAYPAGALIKLLGQCYRGWVKAQPADSVTPGWMWGPDLRPEELSAAPAAASGSPTPPQATAQPNLVRATSTPAVPAVSLMPLEPAELTPPAQPKPSARAVTIEICGSTKQTEACEKPLPGLRVLLMLAATRQVLTSGLTGADGRVMLSASAAEGSQLLLAIPALGLETALAPNAAELPIRVPEGGI